jgi:hypothetical protein
LFLLYIISTLLGSKLCSYLFGFVLVAKTTADKIYKALLTFMFNNGFNKDIMAKTLVAFCNDGTSPLMQKVNCVATLLKLITAILKYFVAWHIGWSLQSTKLSTIQTQRITFEP